MDGNQQKWWGSCKHRVNPSFLDEMSGFLNIFCIMELQRNQCKTSFVYEYIYHAYDDMCHASKKSLPSNYPNKSNKAKQFWNPQIKVVISQNISSYLTMGSYFRAKDISLCWWLSIISCTSNLWVFFSFKHWRYYYWGNVTWEIEICHYRPFLWYPKGIEIFHYLTKIPPGSL